MYFHNMYLPEEYFGKVIFTRIQMLGVINMEYVWFVTVYYITLQLVSLKFKPGQSLLVENTVLDLIWRE